MIFQPHDIKCASVARKYCVKCLGLRAQTIDPACFIYYILYATGVFFFFWGSFEVNFKLKNLKKVE